VPRAVIQCTASDAVVVALLAARQRALAKDGVHASQLVVYTSDQAHSCVKKACMVTGVDLSRLRVLNTTDTGFTLTASALEAAMRADEAEGLVPCAVFATMGTTSSWCVSRWRR
jgi:aromatic-L-amino-acid decarboxylase